MNEIWKDIEGYEGIYQVSNFGVVKSLGRYVENSGTINGLYHVKEKFLIPTANKKRHDYFTIMLCKNGKQKRVRLNRLVAQAFIPNPDNKPEVNHIDGEKSNNRADNLEWVTSKENKEHAWANNLCSAEHRKAPIKCNETGICYESVASASKLIPCDRRGIFRVLKGEKKSIKNLTFSYITKKELEEYRKGINQ